MPENLLFTLAGDMSDSPPKVPEPTDRRTRATLAAPISVSLAADDEEKKPGRFSILAYSGTVVDWYGWRFVVRLTGIRAKNLFPVLYEHERDKIVGHADKWLVDARGLNVEGALSESTDEARKVRDLAREGFPWQASMGIYARKVTRLERGHTEEVNGLTVEGPIDIWEESDVVEVSVVALGADSNTEARIDASQPREDIMDPKLRALLVSLGLTADATEEEAQVFYQAWLAKTKDAKNSGGQPGASGVGSDVDGARAAAQPNANAQDAAQLAASQERERVAGITGLLMGFGLYEKLGGADMINGGVALEAARERVLQHLAKENPPLNQMSVETGADERDRFRGAAAQGILLRLGHRPAEGDRIHEGAHDLRNLGLQGAARLCLERAGLSVSQMSNSEVADAIMHRRADLALSTSDFSGIFLDVVNKILQRAYSETPATWRPLVNVVSAADFRDMYGITLSEGPDLELVRQNEEYKSDKLLDSTERYHVDKYGKIITLSWEMLVNDSLNAFARLPQIFGSMTSRKHSDLVWALITRNPDMSDGKALFSSAHRNLAGTAAVLDSKSLDLAYQAMKGQKGLQGATLDISPRYIVAPPSLRTTALVILNSSAHPVPQMSSGVINVWQNSGLEPIIETRLETGAAEAKPWYLFADPVQSPVIDVAFLDGKEMPDVFEEMSFTVDAISYKVRTVAGAGLTDFRGVYKNAGKTLS